MKHVQAAHYHRGRVRPVRLVVVHCTATPEQRGSAEAVANFFKRGSVVSSAHVTCDNRRRIRSVRDGDTAFAAPGVNADGLHVEIVGQATQGSRGWRDAYSTAALKRAAKTVAEWCVKYSLPVLQLSDEQLREGKRGIIGHDAATRVYGGSHTDPGPSFPWKKFLARVRRQVAKLTGTPEPKPKPKVVPLPPMRRKLYARGASVASSDPYVAAVRKLLKVKATKTAPYGPRTERAVRAFQASAGLVADGVIGQLTDAALRRRNGEK